MVETSAAKVVTLVERAVMGCFSSSMVVLSLMENGNKSDVVGDAAGGSGNANGQSTVTGLVADAAAKIGYHLRQREGRDGWA
jgi:hypothetical protein